MRSKGAWLLVVSGIEGEEPVGTIEHCGDPLEDSTLVEDFFGEHLDKCSAALRPTFELRGVPVKNGDNCKIAFRISESVRFEWLPANRCVVDKQLIVH